MAVVFIYANACRTYLAVEAMHPEDLARQAILETSLRIPVRLLDAQRGLPRLMARD